MKSIIADVIVVLFLYSMLRTGYKRGLLLTIFSLLKTLIMSSLVFLVLPAIRMNLLPQTNAGAIPSYLIVIVVGMVSFYILKKVCALIASIPIIKGLNKIGGLCAGLAQGLVMIWLLFAVGQCFHQTSIGKFINDIRIDSTVIAFVNGWNPFVGWMEQFLAFIQQFTGKLLK